MSANDAVFRRLQSAARSTAAKTGTNAPTQEYLIRHTLESFLDRLTRTAHAEDFVLKGGILLAAYGVRRPTKDADANAVDADVTADHLVAVVHDIAAVECQWPVRTARVWSVVLPAGGQGNCLVMANRSAHPGVRWCWP
ncbi:nucleotidyl transferase AbiEii/AbiGii toxin family protein [Tersicoccus phoenicis]|uniref:nucleotidyl transferase AbiEii/AbiGii toxin family protein n=1 Tax=Tersicoccus phoenicis TaxID=554083 RepID=UPI001C48E990|nr:nucleotidyl transferase AbiEii/AbiGii toxin family protein [Tersicoccus phoenicis]